MEANTMSAGREYWAITHKPNVISRNNNKIVLPAFSANCGQVQASLQFKGSGLAASYTNSIIAFNPFTVEFWLNPQGANSLKFLAKEHPNYSFYATIKANFILEFEVYGSTGTSVTLNTGIILQSTTWQHITITRSFGAGTTTIKLYINGNLAYTGTTAAISNDYATAASWTFGGSAADGTLFVGKMAEMRVWSVVRTDAEIAYGYNKRLGSPQNANLPVRFTLSEGSGVILANRGSEGDGMIINGVTALLNTDDYPRIILGASFIATKFEFTAGLSTEKLSLKFPLKKPAEINFGLCVSWHDEDNNFFRRILWEPDSDLGVVDIAPYPAMYLGERLPTTFDFEVWNIDGFSTVDLDDDFDILLSTTRTPSTSTDIVESSLGTLGENSALASNFPLTDASDYDTQQTYL